MKLKQALKRLEEFLDGKRSERRKRADALKSVLRKHGAALEAFAAKHFETPPEQRTGPEPFLKALAAQIGDPRETWLQELSGLLTSEISFRIQGSDNLRTIASPSSRISFV